MRREILGSIHIAVLAVALGAVTAFAQPPDTLWTRLFPVGTYGDAPMGVVASADGGFIIAGQTTLMGAGGYDMYLVKTDAQGNTLWTHDYGGPNNDYCYGVRQTPDGGYILVGFTGIWPAWDACVVKTDPNGIQQWVYTYNGGSDDYVRSACLSSDGGYVVCGTTMSGGYAALLIKLDASGNYVWHRIFNRPGIDNAWCVQQTQDGGYIISGQTNTYQDTWLIKTDANGYQQWERIFYGGDEGGFYVQQTEDDGYIITGGGGSDLWLIKTDALGNSQWIRTYGGSGGEGGRCVQITADGNYVVSGYTSSYGSGETDIWLLRTNSNGDVLWSCPWGGSGTEMGYSLDLVGDGGYVVGSYTNSFGGGANHLWLLRLEDVPQNMSVNLVPFSSNIQIPASGGAFEFYAFITNSGSDSAWVDLWTKVILPNGSTLGPLMGPAQVLLNPGTTGWYRSQNVPGHALAGTYTYMGNLGVYPNSIWTSDSFQFVKAAGGDGSDIGDWSNWGDAFDSPPQAAASHPSYPYLHEPRPNPFNPSTAISYELQASSFVSLKVYDTAGRLVATLVDGRREVGTHEVTFDGSGLPSGIYIYRLQVGDYAASGKMVLLK